MFQRRFNYSIFFGEYIISSLFLGYIWYRTSMIINTGIVESSILKFSLRFIFGLIYYLLAYAYCILANQVKLKQFLTKLYILFELITLTSGLCRLYVYDSEMVLSIYRTFIKATVSPLAFIMAYVYQSFLLRIKLNTSNVNENSI